MFPLKSIYIIILEGYKYTKFYIKRSRLKIISHRSIKVSTLFIQAKYVFLLGIEIIPLIILHIILSMNIKMQEFGLAIFSNGIHFLT